MSESKTVLQEIVSKRMGPKRELLVVDQHVRQRGGRIKGNRRKLSTYWDTDAKSSGKNEAAKGMGSWFNKHNCVAARQSV